jgi:hypothetical protein
MRLTPHALFSKQAKPPGPFIFHWRQAEVLIPIRRSVRIAFQASPATWLDHLPNSLICSRALTRARTC